jgi:hypothetical protein
MTDDTLARIREIEHELYLLADRTRGVGADINAITKRTAELNAELAAIRAAQPSGISDALDHLARQAMADKALEQEHIASALEVDRAKDNPPEIPPNATRH